MAQVRAEFNFFKPEVKDISYEKIQKLVEKGNVPRFALNSDGKGLIRRLLEEFTVPAAQIDRILAAESVVVGDVKGAIERAMRPADDGRVPGRGTPAPAPAASVSSGFERRFAESSDETVKSVGVRLFEKIPSLDGVIAAIMVLMVVPVLFYNGNLLAKDLGPWLASAVEYLKSVTPVELSDLMKQIPSFQGLIEEIPPRFSNAVKFTYVKKILQEFLQLFYIRAFRVPNPGTYTSTFWQTFKYIVGTDQLLKLKDVLQKAFSELGMPDLDKKSRAELDLIIRQRFPRQFTDEQLKEMSPGDMRNEIRRLTPGVLGELRGVGVPSVGFESPAWEKANEILYM